MWMQKELLQTREFFIFLIAFKMDLNCLGVVH